MDQTREVREAREATLDMLAGAYQRRDLEVFEAAVRSDMTLTLTGSSRLAGTYRGYEAFGRYLEVLRQVMRSAEKPIGFSHREDVMVFKQLMVLAGPDEAAEMPLVVTIRYHADGRIQSFFVQPQQQDAFDRIVDASGVEMQGRLLGSG